MVGKLRVADAVSGRIADVMVAGKFAYLSAFSEPDCTNGGMYVVDISDLRRPRQVGFVPTGAGRSLAKVLGLKSKPRSRSW